MSSSRHDQKRDEIDRRSLALLVLAQFLFVALLGCAPAGNLFGEAKPFDSHRFAEAAEQYIPLLRRSRTTCEGHSEPYPLPR